MNNNIFKENLSDEKRDEFERLFISYRQKTETLDDCVKMMNFLKQEAQNSYSPELWNFIQKHNEVQQEKRNSLLIFLKRIRDEVKSDVNIIEELKIDKSFCKWIYEQTIVFEADILYTRQPVRHMREKPRSIRQILIDSGFNYTEKDLNKFDKVTKLTKQHKQKLLNEIANYPQNNKEEYENILGK